MEHYESVTEARSFSKVAPPPPERSFSQVRGHHDLDTREWALASAEREASISRELIMEKENVLVNEDGKKAIILTSEGDLR